MNTTKTYETPSMHMVEIYTEGYIAASPSVDNLDSAGMDETGWNATEW